MIMRKTPFHASTRPLHNEQGQSAVEYLVVCTALVTLFLISSSHNSVYNMISHTIHDKYSSYSFGVSISDPPSKAFDDKVKHDAAEVKEVIHELEEVAGYLKDHPLPETIKPGDLPSAFQGIIKGFKELVQDLKDLL